MPTFQQAFEQLLSRAPGPVFPKARELYRRKYCLEATAAERFRTFLLQEEIQETVAGALRVRALSFALVHWQGPQLEAHDYLAYLQERWQLQPADLILETGEPWFRQGGAWCHFTAAAVYERAAPTSLVSS
ncbi:MAG: hypothetical protein NTV57_13880 [Cyanobacteria bacterium]|nr:hypothetical protein [Cyanobacteriota bacterium]